MPKKPLRVSELIKRLKPFGVVVLARRGKGSETVLLMPNAPDSKKGELYTLPNHGKKTEVYVSMIDALLRRFGITPDDFWK